MAKGFYASLVGRNVRFSMITGEDVIGEVKSADENENLIEIAGIGESRDVWIARDKIVIISLLGPKPQLDQ
jgi:hypothetical protein